MIVKHVYLFDPDRPAFPLGTFHMDGASVVAVYHSDAYRRDVEQNGLVLVVDGEDRQVFPADGKVFFDALDKVYSHSTFMRVRLSDEPDAPSPSPAAR